MSVGHEVGGKLDTMELQIEHPRERRNQQGFGQTGDALQEAVPTRQQGDEQLINYMLLPHNDF